MRAVVSRCRGARVDVAGQQVGGFDGPGLLALVAATHSDTAASARWIAAKIWSARVFDAQTLLAEGFDVAADGPREVSASDAGLPVLLVSQFSLYARTRKGRRPTWEDAAPGPVAQPLLDEVAAHLTALGATVSTGVFGADMAVTSTNDGPLTLLLDSP